MMPGAAARLRFGEMCPVTEQLEAHYRRFHASARLPSALSRRASAPLLVHPHERWATSKVRLLVVGQETHTWEYEPDATGGPGSTIRTFRDFSVAADGVAAMLHLYRWYGLGRRHPKLNSPFWRGFRALDEALNTEMDSALWTNLFKVNVSGSVVGNCNRAEIAKLQRAQQGLLRSEIDVLKPNVIVFFTGPRYDRAIRHEFGEVEFCPFDRYPKTSISPSRLALVRASGLPMKTIRTYHPEYLQRSRQLGLLSEIVDWAKC